MTVPAQMRGRKLYLELAEASFDNAVKHYNDARALKKRGSRGHACALAVLSLEEAAKAYLYKLAGEGVYRIVSKEPNNISTFSESQLFDHKFKHGIIARLLVETLQSVPVRRVLSKTRKRRFTRAQVERMLADLLHEQAMQQIELRKGGKRVESVSKVFAILESLNDTKNNSLYVGHIAGKINRPDNLSPKRLSEVIDLSAAMLDGVGQILDLSLNPERRKQVALMVREIAAALRRAAKSSRPSSVALSKNLANGA